MGKLLLPDWVSRRLERERLTEALENPPKNPGFREPKEEKIRVRKSSKDLHNAKLRAMRRRQNKNARIARRRNRAR